jgi:uncharacterized protein with PIN domain
MAERRESTRPARRRCPECDVVRPAAEFKRQPVPQRPPGAVGHWATCPDCGHMAPRWAFRSADPLPRTEGGAG